MVVWNAFWVEGVPVQGAVEVAIFLPALEAIRYVASTITTTLSEWITLVYPTPICLSYREGRNISFRARHDCPKQHLVDIRD